MFDGDIIAVGLIWITFFIYLFYSIVVHFLIFAEKAKLVYGRDVDPTIPEAIKHKYLMTVLFNDYSPTFDNRKAIIYFELITKTKSKMLSFSLTNADISNGRAYLLLHRRKVFRPLTGIRMTHDCQNTGAWIHLSAIKVQDMNLGPIVYYEIDRKIHCEIMDKASVHLPLKPELKFFSSHIFGPNFVRLKSDTFSNKWITTYAADEFNTNGVFLDPELDWIEENIFVLFFIFSILFFDVLFAFKLKEGSELSTNGVLFWSAFWSSGLSFNSANTTAFFFRNYIKTKYNAKCSLQQREKDKDSHFWTLAKNLSLSYILAIPIAISPFISQIIKRKTSPKDRYLSQHLDIDLLESRVYNETLFLVLFVFATKLMALTFWLILSGILKYLYYLLVSKPKYIPYESVLPFKTESTGNDNDSTEIMTLNPKKSE